LSAEDGVGAGAAVAETVTAAGAGGGALPASSIGGSRRRRRRRPSRDRGGGKSCCCRRHPARGSLRRERGAASDRNGRRERRGPCPSYILVSLSSFRRRGLLRALTRALRCACSSRALYGQSLKSSGRFKNLEHG
jgi:hypothetical protein